MNEGRRREDDAGERGWRRRDDGVLRGDKVKQRGHTRGAWFVVEKIVQNVVDKFVMEM